MDIGLEVAVVLGLILLNGLFAMAEMAIVSSRRIRLQQMAESGSRGAARALALAENPSRFLSGVQVGITLIGILSGAFGGATLGARLGEFLSRFPVFGTYANEIAFGAVVVAITYVSLIIGELVPKRIALNTPEVIAAKLAQPLQIVVTIARPMVWLLEKTTAFFLAILRIPTERPDGVTEEEVKLAIAEGTESGVIDEVEEEMIHGVLALADRSVAAVLTPRTDVYWIDLDDENETIAREIADCPYSRIVVARDGDIGRPVGIVQKKDILTGLLSGKPLNVEEHIIQPLYVPETLPVLRLLEMFRSANLHIALVVDEYGDFLGVATLHDVLEGIAGDISSDDEGEAKEILKRADGSWLVDGRASLDALKEELGIEDTPSDYHTAAGLALDKLARIPVEGDHFIIGDWRVEVIDMDGKRIDKLIFIPLEPAKAAE
ncbi:MAG: HlyC/CorC family transporter [Xanthobacteraceae bacterium]|nr:HlyC/CorC family transporter [Xanthobacteraceae bacterium]QYK44691.1 MAG: HlyC/CorC family transporter [Xanthobacteraceae bacterium]